MTDLGVEFDAFVHIVEHVMDTRGPEEHACVAGVGFPAPMHDSGEGDMQGRVSGAFPRRKAFLEYMEIFVSLSVLA